MDQQQLERERERLARVQGAARGGHEAFPADSEVNLYGLTVREHFAATALRAALGGVSTYVVVGDESLTFPEAIAQRAVLIADALLAELAKPE